MSFQDTFSGSLKWVYCFDLPKKSVKYVNIFFTIFWQSIQYILEILQSGPKWTYQRYGHKVTFCLPIIAWARYLQTNRSKWLHRLNKIASLVKRSVSVCVSQLKRHKWIIEGHLNPIRSPGHCVMCVCVIIRWDEITVWGERGEKAHTREGFALSLHLLAVLGVKSVCLADWMWSCLNNKGISFSQRWPSTCPLNEFDIDMDTVRRKSERK